MSGEESGTGSNGVRGLLADNFVLRFLSGFWYPLRGFRFILGHLSLLKFCILPVLVNTVLFTLVLVLANYFWNDFLTSLLPVAGSWYARILYYFCYVLALVFGFLVFAVISGFAFATVGTLLASPFNDFLSQRVEELVLEKPRDVPFSMKLMLKDLRRVLSGAFWKLLMALSFFVFVLPLLLIPVAGQLLYLLCTSTFAVWFVALEFVDYSMSRTGLTFLQKSKVAWRFRSIWLGFGTAVYLTLIIPVIGFLCLPISVVGGSLLFLDMSKKMPELLILQHELEEQLLAQTQAPEAEPDQAGQAQAEPEKAE